MNSSSNLHIDWATNEAVKYACEKWHYSKCVPKSKVVKFGVWEFGKFIGVVLFGSGASPMIGRPYNLTQLEICELTRIALAKHQTPVSRIMAIAIKKLKAHAKGLRLIVSFADSTEGHYGGIYQATNWIYAGGSETHAYVVRGKEYHPVVTSRKFGSKSIPWLRANVDPKAKRISAGFKHRYLMPLDNEMRKKIQHLKKPYPKRVGSADSGTPLNQGGRDGANPIPTLQNSNEDNYGS